MSDALEPGKAPKKESSWSGTKIMWVVVGVLFAAVLVMNVLSGEDPCHAAQDAKVHAEDPNFADHDAAVLEYAVQQNKCEQGQ